RLPAPLAACWEGVVNRLTAAFGASLAWSGMRFLDITSGRTSAAMEYPIELLNGMAPVAGALACLFALGRIVTPPPPPAAMAEA
ncbi:MAG: TRAP transporter small permease subunit, partial [Roseococcus sp.]